MAASFPILSSYTSRISHPLSPSGALPLPPPPPAPLHLHVTRSACLELLTLLIFPCSHASPPTLFTSWASPAPPPLCCLVPSITPQRCLCSLPCSCTLYPATSLLHRSLAYLCLSVSLFFHVHAVFYQCISLILFLLSSLLFVLLFLYLSSCPCIPYLCIFVTSSLYPFSSSYIPVPLFLSTFVYLPFPPPSSCVSSCLCLLKCTRPFLYRSSVMA